MGLYDTVKLAEDIELPQFPDNIDPDDLEWQSKDIGRPSMRLFKISEDGRLLRREVEKEKMNQEELDEYAQDNGYDSWEQWEKADTPLNGPLETWKYKIADEWWADHNMHGTFEFHASSSRLDGHEDFYWSYEARFTHGELEKIVFLGDRGSFDDSPIVKDS